MDNAFSAGGNKPQDDSVGGGGSTKNPARRRTKTHAEILAGIEDEGKSGVRFSFATRKKWKGKNDKVRTALASWYEGECQICGKTFTQRSGEPYFEGLYLVPHTKAEWLDRVGNVLCLCPWHSAMFQYGEKEFDGDVIQTILNLKTLAEGGNSLPVLPMKLCGESVQIVFKDNHLLDLQEMIKASQSQQQLIQSDLASSSAC